MENEEIDKIIDNIIEKIKAMPYKKQFTIAELTDVNDNMKLFEIAMEVLKKAKELNIELKKVGAEKAIVGLPQNYLFNKVENRKVDVVETFGNCDVELSEEEKEFEKYCKLYEERFSKKAYIAEPNGTKQKTINAIKICLEKNEDLLDKLLYPGFDDDIKKEVLY